MASRATIAHGGDSRAFLLDVSRLIWRLWSGRLPTGIDRVCLEYVRQFASRSFAVVRLRGRTFVLSAPDSDRLFSLMLQCGARLRLSLIAAALRALVRTRGSPPAHGMIYLNVGHTGLNDAALPNWVERHQIKAVYLVHDLIPITHPAFCRPGEAAKHEIRIRTALVSAAGIIANSQSTLDQVAHFASNRRLPMPPALVAWISGPDFPDRVVPRQCTRPYFVTLGTVEGRKNHILLLRAWRTLLASMGDEVPVLVVIGQRGWEAEEALAMLDSPGELRAHVQEVACCDDEALAAWLSGARALLMPSFTEGFGLPVIEALELGTPIIASDLPVYREVVGDIPTYLDPLDQPAWESAIRDFCVETPERTRQLKALTTFAAPDWETHFARVETWMESDLASPCNNQPFVYATSADVA